GSSGWPAWMASVSNRYDIFFPPEVRVCRQVSCERKRRDPGHARSRSYASAPGRRIIIRSKSEMTRCMSAAQNTTPGWWQTTANGQQPTANSDYAVRHSARREADHGQSDAGLSADDAPHRLADGAALRGQADHHQAERRRAPLHLRRSR